jgi:hypothetical protein
VREVFILKALRRAERHSVSGVFLFRLPRTLESIIHFIFEYTLDRCSQLTLPIAVLFSHGGYLILLPSSKTRM